MTPGHKELSVSQWEMVFLSTFSDANAMTKASDGPGNVPLITCYLKMK